MINDHLLKMCQNSTALSTIRLNNSNAGNILLTANKLFLQNY